MSIEYFQKKADEAKVAYVRDYWLRRKEGAEALARRLEARRKQQAAAVQRDSNQARFNALDFPKAELESFHPNGCKIRWQKPENWEPDTYMVLVREKGQKEWRSVASSNISSETREQVLTRSYLAWGAYKEPYEIAVAAVWEGVGRKLSCPKLYPPVEDAVELPEEEEREPLSRLDQIIQATLTYTGRRTRSGKPYVRFLRRHAGMPRITVAERNEAYRRIQEQG